VCGDHGQLLTAAFHARKSDSNDSESCKDRSRRKRSGHRLSFGGGLNQSLISQYFTYIGQLFHRQPRFSAHARENVSTALKTSVPVDDRSYRCSTIIKLLVGTVCGALLGWTPWLAARLADSKPRRFFQAVPSLLLWRPSCSWFLRATSLVPGPRCVHQNLIPGWHWAFVRVCCATGELPVIRSF